MNNTTNSTADASEQHHAASDSVRPMGILISFSIIFACLALLMVFGYLIGRRHARTRAFLLPLSDDARRIFAALPRETKLHKLEEVAPKQSFQTWWESVQKEKNLPEDVKTQFVCAICLEMVGIQDDVHRIHCLHAFHAACLEMWFLKCHMKCPVCQQTFSEEPGKVVSKV